jgi:hypothetical protein
MPIMHQTQGMVAAVPLIRHQLASRGTYLPPPTDKQSKPNRYVRLGSRSGQAP